MCEKIEPDKITDLIYAVTRESQETVLQRLDAADARIQSVLSASTGVTLAMPIIIKLIAPEAENFSLCWPVFISLLFVWTILVGTRHWWHPKVTIVDAEVLSTWTSETVLAFKKEFIRQVSRQVKRNNELVLKRTQSILHMILALGLEILIFGLWVLSLLYPLP